MVADETRDSCRFGEKSVNWYEVGVFKTDNTPRFYLFNIYFFKSAVY